MGSAQSSQNFAKSGILLWETEAGSGGGVGFGVFQLDPVCIPTPFYDRKTEEKGRRIRLGKEPLKWMTSRPQEPRSESFFNGINGLAGGK